MRYDGILGMLPEIGVRLTKDECHTRPSSTLRQRQHPQAEDKGWGFPLNKRRFGVLKKAEVGATCNIYVLGGLIRQITPTQPQDGEVDQIYPRGYIKDKSVRSIRGPRLSW